LVADLMKGREHDRHSVAKLLSVKPAMAARLLMAAVDHLPAVKVRTEGKKRLVKMELPTAEAAPPYAVAVAACFGGSVWPLFRGSTYEKGIRDALGHVTARTRRRGTFKHIDRKFWFVCKGGEPALIEGAALLDDLLEAVLQHRVVQARYTRFEGRSEDIRFEPLSIVVHEHQLYVVGRDGDRRLHPYRFSRFSAVDVLDESFEYPSRNEYDPEQVFRDSFGIFLNIQAEDVELRLERRWSIYALTHKWHSSQTTSADADGRVRIKLHVRICPELEAWILGFAEEVEVLSPRHLRDRIATRLQVASKRSRHALGGDAS
jgi:hypothetical protein